MATYLVERYLPGLNVDELAVTAARVASVTAELAATGIPIRYLGSTLVPVDEACLCCFEAESAAAVAAANERAAAPFARIVETHRISRSVNKMDPLSNPRGELR
jgi:Protein of unknown function (DUF4242)